MVTTSLNKLVGKLRIKNREDLSFECRLCGCAFYEIQDIYNHLKKSHELKAKILNRYISVKGIYNP